MKEVRFFVKLELDQNIRDRSHFIAFKENRCGHKGVSLFPDNMPSFWDPVTSIHRGGLAAIMRPFPKSIPVSFKSPLGSVCGIPTIYHQHMPKLKPERKARCLQREIENAFEVLDESIEHMQDVLKQERSHQQGQLDYILVPYKDGKPAFGGGTAQGTNALPESCGKKIDEKLHALQARCEQVVTIKVSEMSQFSLGDEGLETCEPFTPEQLWQANNLVIQELIYYLDWFASEGKEPSQVDIIKCVLSELGTRFYMLTGDVASQSSRACLKPYKELFNLVVSKLYPRNAQANWDNLILPHVIRLQQQALQQELMQQQNRLLQQLWAKPQGADKKKRAAVTQAADDGQDEEDGTQNQDHKRARSDAMPLL